MSAGSHRIIIDHEEDTHPGRGRKSHRPSLTIVQSKSGLHWQEMIRLINQISPARHKEEGCYYSLFHWRELAGSSSPTPAKRGTFSKVQSRFSDG